MNTNGPSSPILECRDLVAGYTKDAVLGGITAAVREGEIVGIIGHNGAGKSTLLKTLIGLLPIRSGEIQFRGAQIKQPTPRWWLQHNVVFVPQGQRVFPRLSVREHLEMAVSLQLGNSKVIPWQRCVEQFPQLIGKLSQTAGTLSGGERQMLALASALVHSPRMFLLDEPSLGLAPATAAGALSMIRQLNEFSGAGFLIAEQNVRELLRIAHRICVLRNGRVHFSGPASYLQNEQHLREIFL